MNVEIVERGSEQITVLARADHYYELTFVAGSEEAKGKQMHQHAVEGSDYQPWSC
jgi:hypothetical protein